MNTINDILNFCNDSIFYDHKIIDIVEEKNQVSKYIINDFQKTTPVSRILVSLSLIEDIILKINDNDFENVIEIIHDFRENILNMLSFEKLLRDNNGKIIFDDDVLSNSYYKLVVGVNEKFEKTRHV